MKTKFNAAARKRPVNLTLNEDLVIRARAITNNLSGVVESLLAEFVETDAGERLARAKLAAASVHSWNAFNSESGSIADEYSSL
jgi:antitoxin CcdA